MAQTEEGPLTEEEMNLLSRKQRQLYKIGRALARGWMRRPASMILQEAKAVHDRRRERECGEATPTYERFEEAYQRMVRRVLNNTPYDKEAHSDILVETLRLLKAMAEVWLLQKTMPELQGIVERCNLNEEHVTYARSLLTTIFTTRPVRQLGHNTWYAETNPAYATQLMNKLLLRWNSLDVPFQEIILNEVLMTSAVLPQKYALNEHHDHAIYCAFHANLQGRFPALASLKAEIISTQTADVV